MFSCFSRSKANDIVEEDDHVSEYTRGELPPTKRKTQYTVEVTSDRPTCCLVDDRYDPDDMGDTVGSEDTDDEDNISKNSGQKYGLNLNDSKNLDADISFKGKKSVAFSAQLDDDTNHPCEYIDEQRADDECDNNEDIQIITTAEKHSDFQPRLKNALPQPAKFEPILKKRNGGVSFSSQCDVREQETIFDLKNTFTNSEQKSPKSPKRGYRVVSRKRTTRHNQPLPSFIRKIRNTEEDYGFVPLPIHDPLENPKPLASDVLSNFRIGQSEGKQSTPIFYDEKPTHLYRARSANFPCKVKPEIERPKSVRDMERKKGTLMILPKVQEVNAAALNRYIQKLSMAVKINNKHLFPGLSVTNIDFLQYDDGVSDDENMDKPDQCKQGIHEKVIVEEDESELEKTWLTPREETPRTIWKTVSKMWHLGEKWSKAALQDL